MRFLKYLGVFLLLLIIVYFFGPRPSSPKLTTELPSDIPSDAVALERFVQNHESRENIKPDNEARIIWFNDSLKNKTEYVVVYLHGYTATQEEGDPVHINFAKKFGCNLYLSRLAGHGLKTDDPLLNTKADDLWNSAKEAYAIGKQLGNKVILLSTSTGGTLALKLCAEYPEIVASLMLSPNIEINDPNAWLLNNHWGLQIAKLVKGSPYNVAADTTAAFDHYWYKKSRLEGAVQLEELLETTMKESTFQKIKQPSLMLYYYEDEEHQDKVVKVSAMKRMFGQLATPAALKREKAIPSAGDHVLGSPIKSKDVKTVEDECIKFATEVLKLQPAQQ